jgi:hypothetical protein
LLTWGIVVLFGLGAGSAVFFVHGSGDEQAAIRRAVRAPFADLRRGDARALCADFVPAAETRLTGGGDCARTVRAMLRRSVSRSQDASGAEGLIAPRATVTDVSWHGVEATAMLREAGAGAHRLRLRLVGDRWRLQTPAALDLHADCARATPARPCVRAVGLRFG